MPNRHSLHHRDGRQRAQGSRHDYCGPSSPDELLDAVDEHHPLFATPAGFRYRDDRLSDCGEVGEAATAARLGHVVARTRALDPPALSADDPAGAPTGNHLGAALDGSRPAVHVANTVACLGMLAGDSTRAARLVVDTGIHALGWDREQDADRVVAAAAGPRTASGTGADSHPPGQGCAGGATTVMLPVSSTARDERPT